MYDNSYNMTNREEIAQAIAATILAQVQDDLADKQVKMVVESLPFDPTIQLTHEQLFALPDAQRFQYYDAHGGVFAVMGEMGFALTDEDIDDWHNMQAEEDKEWALEYERRYGKELPR
jgi:hypothetical protein